MQTNATILNSLFPCKSVDERQWVVRASHGKYVDHFMRHGVVAIGHLDKGEFSSRNRPNETSIDELRRIVGMIDENGTIPPKSSITNQTNQAISFISEMKIGDLVLTLDDRHVAIGTVAGDAYFSSEGLKILSSDGKRDLWMRYKTRRSVEWKFSFPRSDLPLNVEHSFRAHQAVFNADRHWEYLYHLIYPIFTDGENLYYSNMIRQAEDIDSFSVSRLLAFYSDLEILMRTLDFEKNTEFSELQRQFREQFQHELICRAQFFSQGPAWFKQPIQWIKDYRKTMVLLIAFQCLFGGNLGFIESPGLITPKMREQVTAAIIDAINRNDMEDVLNRLMLNYPNYGSPAKTISRLDDSSA